MQKIDFHISQLDLMQEYPKELYYSGNNSLLKNRMISIVGTRRPVSYTKSLTSALASKLSNAGITVVSGAAMGVDILAHRGAGASNTIAVLPCGLDHKYPAVNKSFITQIEKEGLLLSQFEPSYEATPWSFVQRNEIVVALGECLIVAEADLNSGSMRSVEFALKMQKDIYVLPHKLGESEGTNTLLKEGLAKPIYDIDKFVSMFGKVEKNEEDELLEFCKNADKTYDEVLAKFGEIVFEYELLGKIEIIDGKIKPS